MSVILGLHTGHDGAACIVRDGHLTSAVAHERLCRKKKCHGVSNELIDYVVKAAGLNIGDITHVALSDWHPTHARGTCEVSRGSSTMGCTWNMLFDNSVFDCTVNLRGRQLPGINIGHHLCHAASAYYTSPFDEAYCATMDASGGELKSNAVIAHGFGNKLTALNQPTCIVGLAYGVFTEWLGLGPQIFKAGSTMALAGYGTVPQHVRDNIDRHVNASLFVGGGDYRGWVDGLWKEIAGRVPFDAQWSDGVAARDIAASIQFIFEQSILRWIGDIPSGDCQNLCLSGGSFLNCNANTLVRRVSKFPNVHLFPACSDDGCCVGAALYFSHHILDEPRNPYADADICYLGADRDTTNADLTAIATAISKGHIVAWFHGKSECGPRALGHRSLLADPRRSSSREMINFRIKQREWFRPLAPSVLVEDAGKWFELDGPSPFMLFTAAAKAPHKIPAVVHVDGSARIQTVTREMNPAFYELIHRFKEITGVPMLVNTSLNGPGEPILETEADVKRFWDTTPVDMLVVDGRITTR